MKALLLLALLFAGSAVAAPLTPASNGHYFDAQQDGQSLELRVLPNGDIFAFIQVGVVPGFTHWPTWYSIQGPQNVMAGSVYVDLYNVTNVVFGSQNAPALVKWGKIRLQYENDTTLFADVVIDGGTEVQFNQYLPVSRAFNFVKLLD